MEGDGSGSSSNNKNNSRNMMMMGGTDIHGSVGENNTSKSIMMMMMMPPPPINSNNIGNDDVANYNNSLFLPQPSSNNTLIQNNNNTTTTSSSSDRSLKTKIMLHPHFHRLLSSYVNCQKVGAPAEVVARLEQDSRSQLEEIERTRRGKYRIGEDPGLDQFMEAYCEMLTKYELEISKPFKEAMLFLSRIDSQLKSLTLATAAASSHSAFGEAIDRNGSSEEELDVNVNNFINPQADDSELKGQLLRKYSGYLGSLKHEFMKKKKKGKLPKEARQQLLDWWIRHYKWPYPSESQKLALAESTGLDQKQINNWFINQRKRHWKPSEEMQFVVMDAAHPNYYMDNNNMVIPNAFPMDISPGFL